MGQSRGKGQKTEEMPIRAFMAESEAAWGGVLGGRVLPNSHHSARGQPRVQVEGHQ